MFAQRAVEFLIQQDFFLPQGRLVAQNVGHRDAAIDEAPAAHQFPAAAFRIEGQGAAADASCLLVYKPVGGSADAQPHGAEPDAHAAAEFDFAAGGLDGFTLQKQQNEAGITAIGQAQQVTAAVDAGLQHQGQVVTFPAPDILFLRLVRQRCQGKTRIGETHLLGVFAENLVRSLNDQALMLGLSLPASLVDAMPDDQLMNFSH